MRSIRGRCHCGNISFELLWPGAGPRIPVRACSCTFCTRHGGVYTSHPDGRLVVQVGNRDRVHEYTFGTGTAEFHVCTLCGVVPVVTSSIDGNRYAVVNVNAFENVDRSDFDTAVTDFDGEDVSGRLARRKRNWIAQVEFG